MKVKFANAEVDIWKLRNGTVICFEGHFVHLNGIGPVDKIGEDTIVSIEIVGGQWAYSDYIEWLEPF